MNREYSLSKRVFTYGAVGAIALATFLPSGCISRKEVREYKEKIKVLNTENEALKAEKEKVMAEYQAKIKALEAANLTEKQRADGIEAAIQDLNGKLVELSGRVDSNHKYLKERHAETDAEKRLQEKIEDEYYRRLQRRQLEK